MSEPAKRSMPSEPSKWTPKLFQPDQAPEAVPPPVEASGQKWPTDSLSVGHPNPYPSSDPRSPLVLRPDASLALREFYTRHVKPHVVGSRRTLESHRNALAHWERLATSLRKNWFRDDFGVSFEVTGDTAIRNPPIGLLVDADLQRFAESFVSEVSVNTVKKVLRVISPWLKLASPRDSHNTGGMGLIPQFPAMTKKLVAPIKQKRFWNDELLTLFWKSLPDDRSKALTIFAAVYGFRREDLKCLKVGPLPAVLPALGAVACVDFDADRVWLRQSKNADSRPDPQEFPLVPWVADWLRRACLSKHSRQRSLKLARQVNPPIGTEPFRFLRSTQKFHEKWEALLKKVGLDQKVERRGGMRAKGAVLQFSLHSFRRYANQRMKKIDKNAALWAFGWGLQRNDLKAGEHTQDTHYDEIYSCPDYVREAFAKLPPLDCFNS